MSSLEQVRVEIIPSVEKLLQSFLKDAGTNGPLNSAMAEYQLTTGGKRLRAIIPSLIYHALGKDPAAAVPLGAAVEMIHNATLVHDDLQDGDEVRRGKPTVWKKFGSPQAINCGDAMFYYALQFFKEMKLDPRIELKLVELSLSCTLKVIEGQTLEFKVKGENFPKMPRYLEVVAGKTSGLFSLPVLLALTALGSDSNMCHVAEQASTELGRLFQIQDDLLDIYGKKNRGKSNDIVEGKVSVMVAMANESATGKDKKVLQKILRKPSQKTTSKDIKTALSIFESAKAKEKAVAYIREIQKSLESNKALIKYPDFQRVLLDLGELSLAPVKNIL